MLHTGSTDTYRPRHVRLAKFTGNDTDAEFFLKRPQSHKTLYNPSLGFFVRAVQTVHGSCLWTRWNLTRKMVYREENAWNYLWFNTADIPGLITVLGGPDASQWCEETCSSNKAVDTILPSPRSATNTKRFGDDGVRAGTRLHSGYIVWMPLFSEDTGRLNER